MQAIDYESLRKDLIDYYGTASIYFTMAVMDVIKVEQATNEELLELANKEGFDISNYREIKKIYYKYRI